MERLGIAEGNLVIAMAGVVTVFRVRGERADVTLLYLFAQA